MDIWWTLHLKRELASVPLARRFLLGTMESVGVDPGIAHDLGLALTEACANAVEHAGGARPSGDDGFQVTATLDGDLLRIEVIDSGPGLPPAPRLVPARRPLPGLPEPVVSERVPSESGRVARPCRRRRRGRATLPGPTALGPARRSRPTPYDTHVLPPGRPHPALPRLPELDVLPDLLGESGRGLFLIRALTDHVRLHNHPQRGAIVSFDKLLKRQALRVAS
ncbi:ATP-binding protein [Kitasatospora kifunensis]|uniref:Serine/threonine-protein kinase RsbW n=1 Tax=Kitasatospora kifunensis TaxID=58351 RepID=A0A7W7R345_KITKI|nr:ATP-binding protein [Kitasatospora kifunensis]MBB4924304.1 serine/threonine-protein kinase RsbW [Kitasatospora kifunensis]